MSIHRMGVKHSVLLCICYIIFCTVSTFIHLYVLQATLFSFKYLYELVCTFMYLLILLQTSSRFCVCLPCLTFAYTWIFLHFFCKFSQSCTMLCQLHQDIHLHLGIHKHKSNRTQSLISFWWVFYEYLFILFCCANICKQLLI